jgi:hypothetical protein
MLRLRDWVPLPHDLVQAVQALKAVVSQWIGHGPSVQACVSAVCGHAAPPNRGATLVRERLWTPAAHVVLHAVQALKAPMLQSIGHACSLHARVSAEAGQALPPAVGATLVRERLWAPVPHDLVHVVYALNVPTWQLAAHACALHPRVSALCGHAAPPLVGSTLVR